MLTLVPAGVARAAVAPGLYWANANTIGHANLDGTAVNQHLVCGTTASTACLPTGVAVDSRHLYFGGAGGYYGIGRANLDGSCAKRNFITDNNPIDAGGVAVDSQHVYWVDGGEGTIGRANLDGTDVNRRFIGPSSGGGAPYGLAVDSQHIYWVDPSQQTIDRANLDGSGVDRNFISGQGQYAFQRDTFVALAVDSHYVYLSGTDFNNNEAIMRANLDGTNLNSDFITGVAHVDGIAVDSRYIYWTNGGTGTIARASLDGTDVDLDFIGAGGSKGVSGGIAILQTAAQSPPPCTGTAQRRCVVPRVIGKLLSAADRAIKQAGCKVGKVTRKRSSRRRRGRVISQRPRAGTSRPAATTVNLVVGR